VVGADAMVASARQVVGGNFPEPEEIAAAEALARLTERAAEAGRVFFPRRDGEDADAEGASSPVIPTSESLRAKLEALEALEAETETRNAKRGDDDSKHPLRRALAAVLALEGNAGAAVAAALAATRKSKTGSPDREAARATCVAVFDAFGQKHPESVAGKRKLANLWFV
jgi:thioredoxin-like negative regulator of GroEL